MCWSSLNNFNWLPVQRFIKTCLYMMIYFEKIAKVFVFDHKIPRSQKVVSFVALRARVDVSVFMRVAQLYHACISCEVWGKSECYSGSAQGKERQNVTHNAIPNSRCHGNYSKKCKIFPLRGRACFFNFIHLSSAGEMLCVYLLPSQSVCCPQANYKERPHTLLSP